LSGGVRGGGGKEKGTERGTKKEGGKFLLALSIWRGEKEGG